VITTFGRNSVSFPLLHAGFSRHLSGSLGRRFQGLTGTLAEGVIGDPFRRLAGTLVREPTAVARVVSFQFAATSWWSHSLLGFPGINVIAGGVLAGALGGGHGGSLVDI
jgi:hypothetical protein